MKDKRCRARCVLKKNHQTTPLMKKMHLCQLCPYTRFWCQSVFLGGRRFNEFARVMSNVLIEPQFAKEVLYTLLARWSFCDLGGIVARASFRSLPGSKAAVVRASVGGKVSAAGNSLHSLPYSNSLLSRRCNHNAQLPAQCLLSVLMSLRFWFASCSG